jgi:hypothetical protein
MLMKIVRTAAVLGVAAGFGLLVPGVASAKALPTAPAVVQNATGQWPVMLLQSA